MAALAVVACTFGGLAVVTATASAGEKDCLDYAYGCTPGYVGTNANGPWAGTYYGNGWARTPNGTHNCTLYVAWRLQQAGMPDPRRGWGNAVDWARTFRPDRNPVVGSVAWWGGSRGSGYGHVAYVEQVANGQVFLRADNFSTTRGYTTAGWTPIANVEGFLHPFDRPAAPTGGNPFGALDSLERDPGGIRATGWAIDPDTAGPIDTHVYSGDGNPGGGNPGAATTANLDRPDVGRAYPGKGSAHGYNVVVPARAAGVQTVCAYGINVGPPGVNSRIGCRTIQVSPDPYGSLDDVRRVPGGVEARGWAIDPDTASPIAVHVYGGNGLPGGGPGVPTTANQARPDVARVYPRYGAAHGFTVFLATGAQRQTVCAYGINNGPGANPQIGCRVV